MNKLLQKASKFKIEEYDDDSRVVKGYASVFSNLDSDMDVIVKGSFTKTIKEWGPEGKDRIKLVAQHDINRPVAKITMLKEDENGLYMEAKFGTHRDGDDYYKMAKEGIINEFSVGFQAIQKAENEKGGYDITEIKLYEVSMVTIAANDEAVVTEVKSEDIFKLVKQVEDKDLAFKLEKEILRLSSQETITQAESDLAVKEDSLEPKVEKQDNIVNQLLDLYN